jgi:Fe-S cluster assembly protein SufD
MPRIHVFLASQSEVHWVTRIKSKGWLNANIDVVCEDSARFYHYDIAKSEGECFHNTTITLKRNSCFEHVSYIEGNCRSTFRVALAGEGASIKLQGLWRLKNSEQTAIRVMMEHLAPHCHSLQKFKGVLSDTSKSHFEGKILVRPIAQKTEAYQINNNLLLGEYALARSKPNLEIFADDVKASHGATTSQVDKEHLFYLKSRGLSESLAKELLVTGFCQEILNQIPYAL